MQLLNALLAITPLLVAFLSHFISFYLLNLIVFKNRKLEFLNIIRSCIGVELLLIQLIVAVYLGVFYDLTSEKVALAAPLIWVMYPIVIGSIKSVQMKFVRIFDVEELYEFLSLNLGAFPYRFLYLGVDSYLLATLTIAIKFIYKTLVYFIFYLPKCRKLAKRI